MFRVAYDYLNPWPEQGPLHIETQIRCEIHCSPELARRRANGFLTGHITIMALAGEPMLILGEPPVWQVPITLRLPGLRQPSIIGMLQVDTDTGEVIPLTSEEVKQLQELAHALATHLTLPTTPTG
jgi:hypothetical protein